MMAMKMTAKAPVVARPVRAARPARATAARGRAVVTRVNAEDLTDAAKDKLDEVTTTLSEYWEDSDEKPALVTLGVYGLVGLIAANGTLRAVDSIPLIPDLLELVGILFSGFFVYQNLLYKPDRAALKETISKTINRIL